MASFAHGPSKHASNEPRTVNITSRDDSRGIPSYSNDPQFPHIKDIIASAQPDFDPSIPLNEYLTHVEKCLQSAKIGLSMGHPDRAFKDYLTATELAVNIIPRHKDFGFWDFNKKDWSQRNKQARAVVKSMGTQMDGVRKLIEDNNRRHNTLPQVTTSGREAITTPTQAENVALHATPISQVGTVSDVSNLPASLRVERVKPASAPKPQHLRGASVGTTDLNSRFARLRMSGGRPAGNLQMPNAEDFQAPVTNGAGEAHKLTGPREMPNTGNLPALPPKLAIAGSVPRPSDPIHAVSNSLQEVHRPPSVNKQYFYGQPIASAVTSQLQRHLEESIPYRPRTPNGVNHAIMPKSRSTDIPHSQEIEAETLSSYLGKYNVLIVDIRDREQFDEGHIFATSIMCIDPLVLKEGTSAEMLEERLVIAPENEQKMFARRNEYDIVVYYDQDTNDTTYLQGNPAMTRQPYLRAFYDTLYEFNEYKPLKDGRPPALLKGGVNAWIDLMGTHALAMSRTAAMLGSTRQKQTAQPVRPSVRGRVVSTNSRYEIRDRRMRNHKFLNESEQAAWREQAQQEEVEPGEDRAASDGEDGEMEAEETVPVSPFVPDYESFLRKFPAVERQSMMIPARRPIVPHARRSPPPIPPIPTRPPPAIPRPSYSGQAELTQPQAPLARQVSSTRQPLYSSITGRRKLPRTGLINFGVTCYMNATLQCLSATLPLANFFTDEAAYRAYIQQNNWKGSNGIMPLHFANVVRALWKDDIEMIKPTTFRNFCGRINKEWGIDRQQDAKEFFDFLVDCIHEDLNINWNRSPLKPLTTEQELHRERYEIADAALIEWSRYEHRDYSFMTSLFAGQHASRLRCLTCNGTSTTYEAFYSISIEIPKHGIGDIYRCLESYTMEERLAPEELWRCPYCKCERDATKRIILTRLPNFLVIHLKRFSASKTERARKIHTPIDFPLRGLTMDQFVAYDKTKQQQQHLANGSASGSSHSLSNGSNNGSDPSTSGPNPAVTPPFNYDCYAVLRHLGSTGDGGHYVSLVKDPGRGCWRKFDDEKHYDFDPAQLSPRDRLQNGEAYILFFQRSVPR